MSHNENSGRERAPRGANCRGDRGARASAGARGADAARSVLGKVGSGARKVGSQARKAGSAVAPHFRRASKADVRAQAEERDAARGQGRPGGRPHGPRAPRDARNAAAQNARGPQRGYGEDEQRFSSAGAYGRDASAAPGGRNVALAGGAGRSSARSGFTAVDGGRSDAYDYGSAYRDDYAAGRDAYGYGAGRSGYGSEQGAYRAGANGYGRDEHAGGYDDVYGHGGYDSGYGPTTTTVTATAPTARARAAAGIALPAPRARTTHMTRMTTVVTTATTHMTPVTARTPQASPTGSCPTSRAGPIATFGPTSARCPALPRVVPAVPPQRGAAGTITASSWRGTSAARLCRGRLRAWWWFSPWCWA